MYSYLKNEDLCTVTINHERKQLNQYMKIKSFYFLSKHLLQSHKFSIYNP